MHFLDLILKKRNRGRLTPEEIDYFISGYVMGNIPDYQVSAMLMAIWFCGLDTEETAHLTFAMRDSGDTIDLAGIRGTTIDKHSTGGVADTTTLIVAPLVAACGLKVAKMSGRGLGHTGGTLDKLESIPGFSTEIDMDLFQDLVSRNGLCVMGQTAELVPADKLLYALRDVTGTVDNISLIAASIMSKKLALGSDIIVLDVKAGNGAFMPETSEAVKLAQAMVAIGKSAGRKIQALVTDMNQPLGDAVGNALEVAHALEILQGRSDGDLKTVSLSLAARLLVAAGIEPDEAMAVARLNRELDSGNALETLARMVEAQGGDPRVCEDLTLLPKADRIIEVKSAQTGFISRIHTNEVGVCALLLGAGRERKDDAVDPAVGIRTAVRLGDPVSKGDLLASFHVNNTRHLDEAMARFTNALEIGPSAPEPNPLIYNTIV